jgi:ATP-binding cassette subfamily C protein
VWWKDENGHLLAFTKQSNEPVCLYSKNSTTYIIKKSCKGTEAIVNNEIAESLEPSRLYVF